MAEKYFPNFGEETPRPIREAIRRALDFIYELRDQLGPKALQTIGNDDITISTSYNIVPHCLLSLPRTGYWLVSGSATIRINGAGDNNQDFSTALFHNEIQLHPVAIVRGNATDTFVAASCWLVRAERTDNVTLRVKKAAGSGTSVAEGVNSTLCAAWAGQ